MTPKEVIELARKNKAVMADLKGVYVEFKRYHGADNTSRQ
jgi:hypothetical protein